MISLFVIKPNTKNLFRIIFYISAAVIVGLIHINHLEFITTTMCLVSIFVVAKFSYFTIFSFILWFSFLQEYIATINPALAAGRLMAGLGVPVYDLELFICIMFFYIFELIVFSTTNVIRSEKEMYIRKLFLKKNTAYLFGIIAFALVLTAYPSLPTLRASLGRDQGFVSSSLVVPLAILLLAVIFDNLKYGIILKTITVLTLVWILFHGDRVMVMGYFVYVILKYMNDGSFIFNSVKSSIFNKRTFVVLIGVVAISALAIRIQITREGASYSLNLANMMLGLLKQGTAGDVVFAFNCSVDMWKAGHCMGVYPYLYYTANILPGANQNYYAAVIIAKYYDSLGGGLFFTEPMISGGLFLTIIHSAVFILLLTWTYNKKTIYHSFLIISFSILIFRFVWYASCAALVKMFLYYVPFTYLMAGKLKRVNIPMRRSRQSGKMEIISPVTGNQLLMRQSHQSGQV